MGWEKKKKNDIKAQRHISAGIIPSAIMSCLSHTRGGVRYNTAGSTYVPNTSIVSCYVYAGGCVSLTVRVFPRRICAVDFSTLGIEFTAERPPEQQSRK